MMHAKRLGIVKYRNRYQRAVLVESRDGHNEWARIPDSNLVLFPESYEEEMLYEVPEDMAGIDKLALELTGQPR